MGNELTTWIDQGAGQQVAQWREAFANGAGQCQEALQQQAVQQVGVGGQLSSYSPRQIAMMLTGLNGLGQQPDYRAMANEWRARCKEALDAALHMGQRALAAERERDAALAVLAHFKADLDNAYDLLGGYIDAEPKPEKPAPVHNPFAVKPSDPRRMGNA